MQHWRWVTSERVISMLAWPTSLWKNWNLWSFKVALTVFPNWLYFSSINFSQAFSIEAQLSWGRWILLEDHGDSQINNNWFNWLLPISKHGWSGVTTTQSMKKQNVNLAIINEGRTWQVYRTAKCCFYWFLSLIHQHLIQQQPSYYFYVRHHLLWGQWHLNILLL